MMHGQKNIKFPLFSADAVMPTCLPQKLLRYPPRYLRSKHVVWQCILEKGETFF